METKGLTSNEALRVLAEVGPNELATDRPRGWVQSLIHVLKEPMLFILLGCAGLYLLLGDKVEGSILLGSVVFMIGINLYQQRKTQKALEALRALASPRVWVFRDGMPTQVSGRDVVPGDIVILSEGDRVPADGKLVESSHLTLDESLLTGESLPLRKGIGAEVFSGTLVVKGKGEVKIDRTGSQTEMGKIGKVVARDVRKSTRLEGDVFRIGRLLFWVSVAFCALVIVVYGLRSQNWVEASLAGLAASLSMLPEELPVILSLFFAMGAWRMSRYQVLTREVAAIENLGATTVLCVDKTGTLTKNEMELQSLVVAGERWNLDKTTEVPERFHELVEYAVLSSHRDPFDPMEKAILKLLKTERVDPLHAHPNWKLEKEYPLSDELLAMSCVWDDPLTQEHVIATKGAPEAIYDLCHLTSEKISVIEAQIHQLAKEGLRVLGVARAVFPEKKGLPAKVHDFEFQWLGLLGLADPLREEVPAAIAQCHEAGIRVVMMTGDYPETARTIAEQAGFQKGLSLLTGKEIEELSDDELAKELRNGPILVRMPHHLKRRVVEVLRREGEVVAMTGDGVNDAPSLKTADIGIAMGQRGTDVAREAADIVLMRDDFASIVQAIAMGRRIYQNIRSAIGYVFALHIPIGGLTLIPPLLGWPLILSPIHLVLLELFIDPSCSLALEGVETERNLMQSGPRRLTDSILQPRFLWISNLRGVLPLGIGVILCYWGLSNGMAEATLRSEMFLFLFASILGLILVAAPQGWWRRQGRGMMAIVLGGAILFIMTLSMFASVRGLLRFGVLEGRDIAIALFLGIVPTVVMGRLLPLDVKNVMKR